MPNPHTECAVYFVLATLVGALLGWLLMTVCLPAAVLGADEGPSLEKLVELYRERSKQAKAAADERRFVLIEQAVRLREKQQAAAKTEREQIELRKKQVEYQIGLRRWALGSFEQREQNRLPPTENLNRRFRQWQDTHDQWKHIFLSSYERSRGAVARGRALNFFLDILGSVAVQHELTREELAAELQREEFEQAQLEKVLGSDRASPEEKQEARRRLDALRELRKKADLLEGLRGGKALTEDHRRKLLFTRGTLGGEIVYSPRDGALPLNWPPLLVTMPQFQPHLRAMEAAKAQGLAELSAGQGIKPETQAALLAAADQIQHQWERFKAEAFRVKGKSTVDCRLYMSAMSLLPALRSGVLRFLEARELSDVEPTTTFRGERIDELLVYMSKQGLRFAPADRNSEYVYDVLYRQLVEYYSKLNALRIAAQGEEGQVEEMARRDLELYQQQHRSVMDDLERALIAEPPRDFAAQFADLAFGALAAVTAWKRAGR